MISVLAPDPDGPNGPLLSPLTKYAYDPFDNVIAIEQVNHTRVQPTDAALIDEVTSHVTFFEYDGMNRQTRIVEEAPAEKRIPDAYPHRTGLQQIRTDADLDAYSNAPFAWTIPSETSGNPVTSFSYDRNSNVVAVTEKIVDSTTRTTAYQYDRLDRLVKIVTPDPGSSVDKSIPGTRLNSPNTNPDDYYAFGETDGLITSFDYDGVGNMTRVVDALGNEVFYHYDAWSRVTDIFESPANRPFTQPEREALLAGDKPTSSDIPITHFDYTATSDGWIETVTDPRKRQTKTQRDYLGRVASIAQPQPNDLSGTPTTHFTYYLDSRIDTVKDPEGSVTAYEYDNRSRLAKSIAPDPDGPLSGLASPIMTYSYNQANELRFVRDPLFRTTEFKYDGLGRQSETVSPDPNIVYDAQGTVTKEPSQLSPSISYLYDSAGNMLQMTDALTHSTTYGYDALFRQVKVTDARGDETTYEYDLLDRLKTLTDANTNLTQWNYNPLDQVETETNVLGDSRGYGYDAVGNTRRMEDRLGRVTAYDYDRRYRTTKERWFANLEDYGQFVANPAANPPLRTLSFGYDPLIDNLTSASDPAASYGFTYDKLDRVDVESHDLTPLGRPVTFDYDFDLVGNFKSLKSTIDGAADFQLTHELDNLHRVTGIKHTDQQGDVSAKYVTLVYDAAGQMT
ncbi:MAG: RHS repeat protein, partial [Planctomycetales bacterium]|nr:RHS repeat protein [Planctomycetales bacterium]